MKNRFVIVLILILTLLCGCSGKTNYVTMYVTNCETAQVREKPSNDAAIIKILNLHDVVSYEKDVTNGYSKIVYDGTSGYVLSKYLTFEKPQPEQSQPEIVEPVTPVTEPQNVEVNLLNNMTTDQRREVNIFLSNFSEAFYGNSDGYYVGDEEKIVFAYIHTLINDHSKIFFEDKYMGLYASAVDDVLVRFFGYSIPHKTPDNSTNWFYKEGKFLSLAAMGESYNNFSVATDMKSRADGNYDVSFNVYSDTTVGGGDAITDKSIYRMSDAQVSANSRFTYLYSGNAILKPKIHNGNNTYELVWYKVN